MYGDLPVLGERSQRSGVADSAAQEHGHRLQEMVRTLMEEHLPKSKKGAKNVFWCSDELGRLRIELRSVVEVQCLALN